MSNYEIYIVELLEADNIERDEDNIRQHIDTAFCQDKITYQQRNEYKDYLEQRIKQEREEQKRFSEERMQRIIARQEELRKIKEYKDCCATLFSVKRAKKLR